MVLHRKGYIAYMLKIVEALMMLKMGDSKNLQNLSIRSYSCIVSSPKNMINIGTNIHENLKPSSTYVTLVLSCVIFN